MRKYCRAYSLVLREPRALRLRPRTEPSLQRTTDRGDVMFIIAVATGENVAFHADGGLSENTTSLI